MSTIPWPVSCLLVVFLLLGCNEPLPRVIMTLTEDSTRQFDPDKILEFSLPVEDLKLKGKPELVLGVLVLGKDSDEVFFDQFEFNTDLLPSQDMVTHVRGLHLQAHGLEVTDASCDAMLRGVPSQIKNGGDWGLVIHCTTYGFRETDVWHCRSETDCYCEAGSCLDLI